MRCTVHQYTHSRAPCPVRLYQYIVSAGSEGAVTTHSSAPCPVSDCTSKKYIVSEGAVTTRSDVEFGVVLHHHKPRRCNLGNGDDWSQCVELVLVPASQVVEAHKFVCEPNRATTPRTNSKRRTTCPLPVSGTLPPRRGVHRKKAARAYGKLQWMNQFPVNTMVVWNIPRKSWRRCEFFLTLMGDILYGNHSDDKELRACIIAVQNIVFTGNRFIH